MSIVQSSKVRSGRAFPAAIARGKMRVTLSDTWAWSSSIPSQWKVESCIMASWKVASPSAASALPRITATMASNGSAISSAARAVATKDWKRPLTMVAMSDPLVGNRR